MIVPGMALRKTQPRGDWWELVLAVPLFLFGLAATGAMLLIGPIICGVTVPYVLNSWLHYAGRPEVVTWWMGGLVGLVGYFVPYSIRVSIVAVLGTWIALLFVG